MCIFVRQTVRIPESHSKSTYLSKGLLNYLQQISQVLLPVMENMGLSANTAVLQLFGFKIP